MHCILRTINQTSTFISSYLHNVSRHPCILICRCICMTSGCFDRWHQYCSCPRPRRTRPHLLKHQKNKRLRRLCQLSLFQRTTRVLDSGDKTWAKHRQTWRFSMAQQRYIIKSTIPHRTKRCLSAQDAQVRIKPANQGVQSKSWHKTKALPFKMSRRIDVSVTSKTQAGDTVWWFIWTITTKLCSVPSKVNDMVTVDQTKPLLFIHGLQ